VNFCYGEIIRRFRHDKQALWWLWLGIMTNLGILGYFKYTNFLITNINFIITQPLSLQNIVLPIGLSFFTFEQIAYLVDVYRSDVKHYSFLDYCYFVTFFPRLIAGPIIRHHEVLTQIERAETYQLQHNNIAIGFSVFFIGLFKKVVIADQLALIADPIFSGGTLQPLSTITAWIGALAYSAQLYFDFSGYSVSFSQRLSLCSLRW
jgi:alginate O-acetyltransferase complex protein AlgI